MKNNQKGFGLIEGLLMLVIFGLIGFVGWYVWHSKNNTNSSYNNAVTSSESPGASAAKWLSYKNNDAGLTFQYPSIWKSAVDPTIRNDDGTFGGVNGTVTSPNGNKLDWVFYIVGGKGGDCVPNPGDVAFSAAAKCSSKQIISLEKAQSVKPPTNKDFRDMYEDSLYITRTKYMAAGSNKTTYQICLDPYYTSEKNYHPNQTPQVGTEMGLLFPCEIWTTGFNAKFEVKSEADFNSADAKTAEQIMKTFNSF